MPRLKVLKQFLKSFLMLKTLQIFDGCYTHHIQPMQQIALNHSVASTDRASWFLKLLQWLRSYVHQVTVVFFSRLC